MINRWVEKYGDVAESVDALDSKSRSLYVSEGSSPSIPTYLDKEKQCFSFVVLDSLNAMFQVPSIHDAPLQYHC